MKTKELLENDKKRLMDRLSQAGTTDRAADVCGEEIGRLLLRFHEENNDENMARTAAVSLQTLRAAAPLIDSVGDIRLFERVDEEDRARKGNGWAIPFMAGLCLLVIAVVLIFFAGEALRWAASGCLAAGGVLLFLGGISFGRRKPRALRKEQHMEAYPDPGKIYRSLSAVMTVIDRNLDEAHELSRREEDTLSAAAAGRTGVTDEELQLFSGILESAYSRKEEADAKALISDVRFYLHKKEIEIIDFDQEHERWFYRMPSKRTGTLRPALVRNGSVLVKGMAAGGI